MIENGNTILRSGKLICIKDEPQWTFGTDFWRAYASKARPRDSRCCVNWACVCPVTSSDRTNYFATTHRPYTATGLDSQHSSLYIDQINARHCSRVLSLFWYMWLRVLGPQVTSKYGSLRLQISFMWFLEYCELCSQQIMATSGRKRLSSFHHGHVAKNWSSNV